MDWAQVTAKLEHINKSVCIDDVTIVYTTNARDCFFGSLEWTTIAHAGPV